MCVYHKTKKAQFTKSPTFCIFKTINTQGGESMSPSSLPFAGPSLSAAKTAPLFCAACVSHFCLLWRQVAYKSNGCRSDVGHRWWWNPFRTGKVRGARSRGPVFIFGWRRHEKFYLKPPLSAAGIYLHTLRPNTCNLSPLNGHQSFQGPFCLTWRGNSHQKVPQQGSMS